MLSCFRPPLLLWILLPLAVAPLAAQQVMIRGTVISAVGERPIEAVEIVQLPGGAARRSDVDGSFVLRLDPATQTVRFRRPGYAVVLIGRGALLDSMPLTIAMASVPTEVAGLTVLGEGGGGLARLPGSGAVIGAEALGAMRPLSSTEVLRGVAGVHIQDEEGMGLRANIGIRGIDPDRSRSVLVLEDGIPVALNPYGEPEMYYTPPIDRMDRIEVVKGSGSILHGPQTVGGIINFVTPEPGRLTGVHGVALGGGGGFAKAQVSAGAMVDQTGLLGIATYRRADDLRGLGFDQVDVMLKGSVPLGPQDALGLKVGVYDERSNSTYVGLTDSLFRADPLAYPGKDDFLEVRRLTANLSHQREWMSGIVLKTVAYAYTTTRNWSRQNYSYNSTGSSIVYADATGNRDRSFQVGGIESRLRAHNIFGEFEGGLRGHVESARDRFLNGGTATSRTGALRDDERRRGTAFALFAQQSLAIGSRVRVTPGARLEHFRFRREVLRTRVRRTTETGTTNLPEDVDLHNDDILTTLIPGIGASWVASPGTTLFAGIHRGFAPPRTKDAFVLGSTPLAPGESASDPVSLRLDAEQSWNIEIGTRSEVGRGIRVEATLFRLDFSNQIVEPSLSSGSVSQARLANQGSTLHRGVEAALDLDLLQWGGPPLRLGGQVTLVNATFSKDRLLLNGSDTVNVRGNRLPYAPGRVVALHLEYGGRGAAGLRLDGTFVGEQFSDNFETRLGSANGRIGAIPAHSLWHLSGSWPMPGSPAVLVGSVKNLFDRTYIASRRPEGIKPGVPRTVQLGLEWGI